MAAPQAHTFTSFVIVPRGPLNQVEEHCFQFRNSCRRAFNNYVRGQKQGWGSVESPWWADSNGGSWTKGNTDGM